MPISKSYLTNDDTTHLLNLCFTLFLKLPQQKIL
jgi:hypothetical protein